MSLENFIREHRDEFDQDAPTDALWQRLATQLPEQAPSANGSTPKKDDPAPQNPFLGVQRGGSVTRRWWAVAASVALLLGVLWWVNARYDLVEQPEVVTVSPAYAKEVAHYASMIDDKRDELKAMTANNPDLYQQFAQDLDRLEVSYSGLKKDLPDTPNQEILIQAMIQNLQLQIDLLNEQLRVIQRMKQQNTTHETV
jgi:cytoskeletal protein RodZ